MLIVQNNIITITIFDIPFILQHYTHMLKAGTWEYGPKTLRPFKNCYSFYAGTMNDTWKPVTIQQLLVCIVNPVPVCVISKTKNVLYALGKGVKTKKNATYIHKKFFKF